jgi:CheY-like chemotaxis protein
VAEAPPATRDSRGSVHRSDVVVVDLQMPDLNGIDAAP